MWLVGGGSGSIELLAGSSNADVSGGVVVSGGASTSKSGSGGSVLLSGGDGEFIGGGISVSAGSGVAGVGGAVSVMSGSSAQSSSGDVMQLGAVTVARKEGVE